MNESQSITVKINPYQGVIDANANGIGAIGALVLIVAIMAVTMIVVARKRPSNGSGAGS